jgi:hypothetical protein
MPACSQRRSNICASPLSVSGPFCPIHSASLNFAVGVLRSCPQVPGKGRTTALAVPAGAHDAKSCRCFARALRPTRTITDRDDWASLRCVLLALDLRPGTASPRDSADHIATLDAALPQLPEAERGQVLLRADSGACSKALLHHVTAGGLEYSIGFPALETVTAAVEVIPAQAWRVAAVAGEASLGPAFASRVFELDGRRLRFSHPPARVGRV